MKILYSIVASNVCLIHDIDPEEDLRPKEAIRGDQVMVKTPARRPLYGLIHKIKLTYGPEILKRGVLKNAFLSTESNQR